MITIQCTACWCSWNKLALLLNLIQLKERFNIKSPVFLFLLEMNTTWQKLKDARGIFLPLLRRKTVIKLQLFCFFLLWTTDTVCVCVCVKRALTAARRTEPLWTGTILVFSITLFTGSSSAWRPHVRLWIYTQASLLWGPYGEVPTTAIQRL